MGAGKIIENSGGRPADSLRKLAAKNSCAGSYKARICVVGKVTVERYGFAHIFYGAAFSNSNIACYCPGGSYRHGQSNSPGVALGSKVGRSWRPVGFIVQVAGYGGSVRCSMQCAAYTAQQYRQPQPDGIALCGITLSFL